MELINSLVKWGMRKRIHQIELFMKYPLEVQHELLKKLIYTAQNTEWGIKYFYSSIKTEAEFKEIVPLSTYEDLYPYIERILKGENSILWPTKINMFAKSSGTTNANSKFIPVSTESLKECHYKGGKDMLSLYINNNPDTKMFAGKGLSIGGSHQINHMNPNTYYGDVSAVIMKNLPFWAQIIRTPSLDIALMDNWEEKIDKMAESTIKDNVTSLSGVPTWTILLLQRILEITGKSSILEVWPNLECFVHGAVAFSPYTQLFKDLIPSEKMNYMEVYTASEGFFGIEDLLNTEDMLLMLDYGIYYEFIPMENFGTTNPKTLDLSEVALNKNYAMVISTNAGLWRYIIGDTVRFTSLNPFRIRVTGRTKHFINAFGEELVVENADKAISLASQETNAEITNYTAGPIYISESGNGGHEWIIEFEKSPNDINRFGEILDQELRKANSDYDAKRKGDIALKKPLIHSAQKGTFYSWLKSKGKLGGQYKVPRLSNTREFIEDIVLHINQNALK